MNAPSSLDTQDGNTRSEELQLVSFRLGDEEYGVDILKVQEINRMITISRIPKAPDYVEGIINLRGKVIPIINLRKRFDLPPKEKDKKTRIIVVNIEGKILGVIVDAVSEVLRIQSNTVEPPPPVATGKGAVYIKGVGKIGDKLLILLDLGRLFGEMTREIYDTLPGKES